MKDRVVVITGASGGIGAALAELLGARGAKLLLAARREPELRAVAQRAGSEAAWVGADVTCRKDVVGLVHQAVQRFGHIDAWINNAGQGISRVVSELTDEDFDAMMLINAKAPLYGMQAVLPHFISRERGHIINISSLLGRLPLAPIRSAYSAAKHALNALTANLRVELGSKWPDIHVSSVHPGVVATEFGSRARHGGPDSRQLPNAQAPEEVAAIIAELLEHPRADVYTQPGAQAMVSAYYGAEDLEMIERQGAIAPPGAP